MLGKRLDPLHSKGETDTQDGRPFVSVERPTTGAHKRQLVELLQNVGNCFVFFGLYVKFPHTRVFL